MRTNTHAMNKENCTKGPVTVTPFLTPDKDEDPMMVYEVEGGDLQSRFDSVDLEDEAAVAAIHAENNANAELIAEAFNVLHETGMTPRELAEQVGSLLSAMLVVCYALGADRDGEFPKGRTSEDLKYEIVDRAIELVVPEFDGGTTTPRQLQDHIAEWMKALGPSLKYARSCEMAYSENDIATLLSKYQPVTPA